MRKHVFWGIWIAFYINITCGLALISQEKDILHDVLRQFPRFSSLSPAAFAAATAGIIATVLAVDSVFNTLGRIGFSTLSDHFKRRETSYFIIFVMSIAVCLLQIVTNSIDNALLWRCSPCSSSSTPAMAAVSPPCRCCSISISARKPSPPRTD